MKSLLPIGSVVQLKGLEHRVMIYGRIQRDNQTGKVFDYAGCFYPEGIQTTEKIMLFNSDDIQMIFFIGFQDVDELVYRSVLIETINKHEEKEK